MFPINIIFCGEDKDGFWNTATPNITSAEEGAQVLRSRFPKEEVIVEETTPVNNYSLLKSAVEKALPNALPSNPISQNKVRGLPDIGSIMQYIAPDLDNQDYYPEMTVNPTIANASNQTFGSFPIFSSAVLAPAGLWDKRRKAVADYMLDIERAKAAGQAKLALPKFEYQEGNPDWSGVINRSTVDDFAQLQNWASESGVQLGGATDVGHPLNPTVNDIITEQRHKIELTKNIQDKVAAMQQTNLAANNAISRDAMQAMNEWRYFSSLPENAPVNVAGNQYQGKYGLLRDKSFIDRLEALNNTLQNNASLIGLAQQRITGIKEKIQQDFEKSGGGQDYDVYVMNRLESQYPLAGKINPITGEKEMSPQAYIRSLALEIARNKPEMFKDPELAKYKEGVLDPATGEPVIDKHGYQHSAPYQLSDLEDMIRNQFGYEKTESALIAGSGGGGASDKIDASPQYVQRAADMISRGIPIHTKGGKGAMYPGSNAVTFNINGVWRTVPLSNKKELVNAVLEMGGADNELGDVDAPTAIANIQTREDIYQAVNNLVRNTRPVKHEGTGGIFQNRFNSAMMQIAGKSGLPIVKGITVSSVKSLDKDGSDKNFYFNATPEGTQAPATGTIIPEDALKAKVTKEGISIWDFFSGKGGISDLFDQSNTVFIPKEGKDMFLGQTYYHKNPPDKSGISTYTVYDANTNLPYKFEPKDKTEKPYEITLTEYQVKKLTDTPSKLLKKSTDDYPEDQDNLGPKNVQVKLKENVATKKGGTGGSVYSIEQENGNDLLIAHIILQNKAKTGVSNIQEALSLAKRYSSSTDPNAKDMLNKFKKAASGLNEKDIRKLYE